jgi:ribosomal protein S20
MLKAQTNTELKDFIIKNSVAIRTVQKNMISQANTIYVSAFKTILKNQEAAIKLYNTDKKASTYFAFLVRTESLEFLKKNTRGSTDYFEISVSEQNFTKTPFSDNSKVLSSSVTKTIDDLDVMNSQSLNNLNLTIQ